MKNIFIVLTVLAMASTAAADLQLSVDGDTGPSDIKILISDVVVIDIHGDGTTPNAQEFYLQVSGVGSLVDFDISGWTSTWRPGGAGVLDLTGGLYYVDLVVVDPTIPPLPAEAVMDGLLLTGLAKGDVTLEMKDATMRVHDTLAVEVIPEPITLALLGIGGLFLRRRK